MNRIQLAKLRDIAIEYLPAAQQYREEVKARPTEDRESQGYAWALWRIADETIARHEATGEELAAAGVLLGITSYELYDPSDIASASLYKARGVDTDPKKMRAAMQQGIMNAAETLANVTGRDIPLVDPLVYFVDPVTPADVPAAKVKADTSPSGEGWEVQARAIADECFDIDTKGRCRDSLKGYSKRVMELMQERGVKGARGIIDNPATIMREALQGKKWWANKSK